jgi:predicted nucleotidyltransferase
VKVTRERLLKKLKTNAAKLKDEHHVSAIYIFGSFARGSSSSRSDVDILIDFSSSDIGLFEFVRLKNFLESILDRKVDLVTRDALSDSMKGEIERTLIRAA